jgi:hypothetical protein
MKKHHTYTLSRARKSQDKRLFIRADVTSDKAVGRIVEENRVAYRKEFFRYCELNEVYD